MRLAAQAKGGFYPAPAEAVALAASTLVPPDKPFTILDPCAGRGGAIAYLGDLLGCPRSRTYAIELDEARSAACRDHLGEAAHVVGPATFFGAAITTKSFSLVWCNPPFDDEIGGGNRVEGQFLGRATQLLVSGGVIVLVCPESTAERYDVRSQLLGWYTNLTVLPFPEDCRKFNEVIVLGKKLPERRNHYGLSWQNEQAQEGFTYVLPRTKGPRRFEKIALTEAEMVRALSTSPLRRQLQPPGAMPLPQPPLSLGTGHLALLLSAGHLDGVVHPECESPHVVRGTARKKQYLSGQEEIENDDGSVTTKTTISEKIVLSVRCVGPDGKIVTLSQE